MEILHVMIILLFLNEIEAEKTKTCKNVIENLDVTERVTSSTDKGTNIFTVTANDKKAFPLSMVSDPYFSLAGKDNQNVKTTKCLQAGVTHELTIESQPTKTCEVDSKILTVIVNGTVPDLIVPETKISFDITSSDVTANQVSLYDINITNTAECTAFTCDVRCTNSDHEFDITGTTSITTTVDGLSFITNYQIAVTCYDTYAKNQTSITKMFRVKFTTSITPTAITTTAAFISTTTLRTPTATKTTPTTTILTPTATPTTTIQTPKTISTATIKTALTTPTTAIKMPATTILTLTTTTTTPSTTTLILPRTTEIATTAATTVTPNKDTSVSTKINSTRTASGAAITTHVMNITVMKATTMPPTVQTMTHKTGTVIIDNSNKTPETSERTPFTLMNPKEEGRTSSATLTVTTNNAQTRKEQTTKEPIITTTDTSITFSLTNVTLPVNETGIATEIRILTLSTMSNSTSHLSASQDYTEETASTEIIAAVSSVGGVALVGILGALLYRLASCLCRAPPARLGRNREDQDEEDEENLGSDSPRWTRLSDRPISGSGNNSPVWERPASPCSVSSRAGLISSPILGSRTRNNMTPVETGDVSVV